MFNYFGSYLVMSKDYWLCYMTNFGTTKNLIGNGMLAEYFKTISRESSSADSLIIESVNKIS